jgi:small subunit ribosomal protein S1
MSNPSMVDRDPTRDPESQTASEIDASFGDILTQYEQSHSHRPEDGGQGREGTVVAVSQDSVFLDIGLKTEGTLPLADLRDDKGAVQVKPGDRMQVSIKGRDGELEDVPEHFGARAGEDAEFGLDDL